MVQLDILNGVRVIEEGTFITGPLASMLLADMGADVVKVERPESGDPFRNFEGNRYSPPFVAFNRNKRSIVIDHKVEEDRDIFCQLIKTADVYIQNFRPGVAERLGVDYPTLRRLNSRMVYCEITGFGRDGPYADRPSYDTVAQALSGYLGIALDPSAPRISGPATADTVTGLYAAQAILGGVIKRLRTGEGMSVEVSMLESMAHFMSDAFTKLFHGKFKVDPYLRAALSQSFVLECSDGKKIAIHMSSPPKFWRGLLEALDRMDLAGDPRFVEREGRVINHESLRIELQKSFLLHLRVDLLDMLVAHGVPCAPVHDLEEVLMDPQVLHLGLIVEGWHPLHGVVRAVRPAFSVNGVRSDSITAPPVLDEHRAEIIAELRASASR